MKSYAEAEILTDDDVRRHARATKLVASLPSEFDNVRCHELARAVGQTL